MSFKNYKVMFPIELNTLKRKSLYALIVGSTYEKVRLLST